VRLKRAKQRGRRRGEVVDAITITPALLACLLELKASGPTDCLYVFPTGRRGPYTDRGFKTLWQRIVLAAIAARVISADARLTFHDLRAFYATQHKAATGALPDMHKNPATTAGIYDRNKVVKRSAL
jgi:integrase